MMKLGNYVFVSLLFFSASLFAAEDDVLVYGEEGDYASIQEAINDLANLGKTTLELPPGVYELGTSLFLRDGISLQGQETARTVLKMASGSEDQAILVVRQLNGVTIRNLTFRDARVGISFQENFGGTYKIHNNVFFLGVNNDVDQQTIAIELDNAIQLDIQFNTFYKNNNAIKANAIGIYVQHNIFSQNETYTDYLPSGDFQFNCFYNNGTEIPLAERNESMVYGDPQFAFIDEENGRYDFHLKQSSPCKDMGDPLNATLDRFVDEPGSDAKLLDFGAYGGPNRDEFPFPISIENVTASLDADSTYTLTITWKPSFDFMMTADDAEYVLEFGTESGEYDLVISDVLTSPLTLDENNTDMQSDPDLYTTSVQGFDVVAVSVATPSIKSITPANERLLVSWKRVEGATSYTLSYARSGSQAQTVEGITSTEYTLEGLENGVDYDLSVTAFAEPVYYFYVRAREGLSGNAYESQWDKGFEYKLKIGDKIASDASSPGVGMPDFVQAYPALPNEGCFIATATYGSYDAAQVQLFRDFRDQFLMTNSVGRSFVAFYYRYGPIAAAWLNEMPFLKPFMQVILYPYLLLASLFLTVGGLLASVILSALLILVCITSVRTSKRFKELYL